MQRPPFRDWVKWKIGVGGAYLLSLPLALLPYRLAIAVGARLSSLFYYLLKRERKRALVNVGASLPFLEKREGWESAGNTPHEIVRRTFANFGKSFIELIKLYYGFGNSLIERVQLKGLDNLNNARSQGKGVVLITGHCGNWELLGCTIALRCWPMAVIARRQHNKVFNGAIERLRTLYGNSVIYSDGAARKSFYTLRAGGTVCILIDQVVPPSVGKIVKFLGRPAWMPSMPAIIAEKTGAPLVPVFIHREGSGHVLTFYPALDIASDDGTPDSPAVMQLLTGYIDDYIGSHPDEWLWMYNRWKNVD